MFYSPNEGKQVNVGFGERFITSIKTEKGATTELIIQIYKAGGGELVEPMNNIPLLLLNGITRGNWKPGDVQHFLGGSLHFLFKGDQPKE